MSVISGILAATSQNNAADQSAQSQKDANALNKQMYDESRGSTGHAVLPIYFGDQEKALGRDVNSAYDNTYVPLSSYRDALTPFLGAKSGSTRTATGIFNGDVTNTLLSNQAPVGRARVSAARENSLDALHKTLDSIDTAQAAKGFDGDSFGNRLLKFQAAKAGGDAISGANIDNLSEQKSIRDYGNVMLPLQNLNLPYELSRTAANDQFTAQDSWLQGLSQRLQPYNFSKIGYTGPFQYQPIPVGGGTSELAGALAGGDQIASGALNYYLKQKQQNQIQAKVAQQQAANNWTSYTKSPNNNMPTNFSALDTVGQANYAGQYNAAQNWIANNPDAYASYQ